MGFLGKVMSWVISSGIVSSGSMFATNKYLTIKREFQREETIRKLEDAKKKD